MSEPVEEGGRHLCISEHGRPFAEREVGGHDDGGLFIELADKVEQELTALLCERQVAEFVEDEQPLVNQLLQR